MCKVSAFCATIVLINYIERMFIWKIILNFIRMPTSFWKVPVQCCLTADHSVQRHAAAITAKVCFFSPMKKTT